MGIQPLAWVVLVSCAGRFQQLGTSANSTSLLHSLLRTHARSQRRCHHRSLCSRLIRRHDRLNITPFPEPIPLRKRPDDLEPDVMCHTVYKIVGLDAEIGHFTPLVRGRQVLCLVEGAYVLDVDGVEAIWTNAAEDGG